MNEVFRGQPAADMFRNLREQVTQQIGQISDDQIITTNLEDILDKLYCDNEIKSSWIQLASATLGLMPYST